MSNRDKHKESIKTDRRKFVKGVAVATGAATVAMASGGAAAALPEEETRAETEGSKGYHETQHVLDYYDTARR